MKEFIIFVCTDSTEIIFSKLRSADLNYNLPSFFTVSYCAGVSNKHCLLTFFIFINKLITRMDKFSFSTMSALDPDHAQHNVGPDLAPNCLTF